LDTGPNSAGDYIRQYQVYVSNDGTHWGSAVVDGAGSGQTVTIMLPTQTAQYVRIVGTGSSGSWWSIGEVNVYSPSSSTSTGIITAPTTVPQGVQLQTWSSPSGAQVTVVYNGTGSAQSFSVSSDGSMTYTLPSGASAMFTVIDTSKLPQPTLISLTPNAGMAGQAMTLDGSNFGPQQGLGTVEVGSVPAIITGWSDTSITALVPNGLPAGSVTVSAYASDGLYAGSQTFTVQIPPALPRTGWTATASNVSPYGDVPANMLDGNINTRYSSGTGQYNGMWIEIDMGAAKTFDEIVMDSGPSTGDYAHSADVYVSNDGTNWTKVSSVVGTGPAVTATFPTQTARYVKVVNTSSSGSWWSIAEFNAYNT
jgi:hypothetical protein